MSLAPLIQHGLSPEQTGQNVSAPAAEMGSQSPPPADISFSAFQGESTRQLGTVKLTFRDTPIVEQSPYGATIAMAGAQMWSSPGDPMVPVESVMLLLPPGSSIAAAHVEYAGAGVAIAENTALAASPLPAQPGNSEAIGNPAPSTDSRSFSGDSITTFSNYTLAGYHLGLVRVFPVHYDASTRTTVFYPNVSIHFETDASADTSEDTLRPLASDTQRVAGMVVNPDMLTSYQAKPLSSNAQPLGLPSSGQYDYVIITSSGLASSFQPLVNQKISRHLAATSVTTEYIYANYTGTENGDNADRIRQFIADAYDHWGTRWVLLGGDTSLIPMRKVYASAFGSTINNALPTDMYYADPHGAWNSDGDSLWGETNDGAGGGDINLFPEVYVGRAPVSNAGEVANFVNKTIQNETTRNPNPKTSVWVSDRLDSSTDGKTSNEQIISQVLPADWNSQGLTRYASSAIEWTSQDEASVITLLNAGPTLVNSVGHSNATHDSALTVSDVAGLTNSFPYFIYSTGCNSGGIEQADPSIAEEQIVAPHGALGAVMNTDLGWYAPGASPAYSHTYNWAFWNAVFNDGKVQPGQANEDSKFVTVSQSSTSDVYRWVYFETNLYGDPETPLQVGKIGEVRGSVWNDANHSGTHDPAEQGLAGDSVFVDLNQNATVDSNTVSLPSSDVPKSIPGLGAFTSTLAASNLPGSITDVNVTLNITYLYDLDLNVYLMSPAGTRIQLFSGIGRFNANFTNTTLDDQASISIFQGSAPYTGTFRPTGGLAKLKGEQPNGTWTLEVRTTYGFDTGTLNSWSVQIASAEPSTSTAADGSYFIPNLPDGTFQVRHVPRSGWSDTNPVSSTRQVTIANGAIVSGVNFLSALANQAPVLSGIEPTALVYTEHNPATAITAMLTASDVDNTNLAGATIQITANYQNGEDLLSFTNTATITGMWNATTGTLTLGGSDTVANYQAALRAVKYQNTGEFPTAGTRTVSFKVNDGQADSNLTTRNITVNLLPTFHVTSLTPTTSGLDLRFSRPANPSLLNLYDGIDFATGQSGLRGAADITVVGAVAGEIHGSLVWDAATNIARFVKTGGALAPDTYTVTLFSRSNGWVDTSSELLDGDFNGVARGNYTGTFTVAPSSDRLLSLPDFVRGPTQPVNVFPNGTAGKFDTDGVTPIYASGLPISISNGTDVVSVQFDLNYNPALLDISGVALGAGVPMSGWSVTWSKPTADTLHVTVSGSGALAAGTKELVVLTAQVPAGAPYGAAEVLRFTSVQVNGGQIAARGDEAIHKAVYFGDASGEGYVGSEDAAAVSRVVVDRDSGFYAAPLTDPVIIGGVAGDGSLSSYDAAFVVRKSVGYVVPEIPDPGSIPTVFAGVDPTVQIGHPSQVARPGDTVNTGVRITDSAAGLLAANFTITYDTRLLDLANADVHLSTYAVGQGWGIATNVNRAAGIARIGIFTAGEPLPAGTPELLSLAFHVPGDAKAGTSPLAIAGVLNGGQLTMTAIGGSITIQVPDTQPPQVTRVLVSSSAWGPSFTSYLAGRGLGNSCGYGIPGGAGQLDTLPWVNLNKVSVVFSEDVNIRKTDLQIRGSKVPLYGLKDFGYNPATFTATWTLSGVFRADRLLLDLGDTVNDRAGNRLDGEWGDVVHAYPSGNGTGGGGFKFWFNVLPGDVNRSARVDQQDSVSVARLLGKTTAKPGYSIFADVDGDGAIGLRDLAAVCTYWSTRLPSPQVPLGAASNPRLALELPTLNARAVDRLAAEYGESW